MASKRRVRAVVLRKKTLDVDDHALLLAARANLLLAVLAALTTLLLWAFADIDLRLWWGEGVVQLVALLLVVRFRSRIVAALLLLLMLASLVFSLVEHLPLPRVVMAGLGAAVALWLLWTAVGANADKGSADKRARLDRPPGALPALVILSALALWMGVGLAQERITALRAAKQAGDCAPGAPCASLDAGPPRRDVPAADLQAAERLLEAEEPSLPDCYTGEAGQLFVYRGPDGKDVVVERITEVPKSLRKDARCAR